MSRPIGTLLSGSVIGQIAALAAYPVVTRLFTPDDFGLYNIFYSYIDVLMIVSTGKYEQAFPVASSDAEARALLRFVRWLNVVVSLLILMAVALLLASDALPGETRQLGSVALLVAPLVYFGGTVRIHSFLFNRYESYKTIASSTAIYGLATSSLKVVFGLFLRVVPWLSRWGLPLATVLGQAASDLPYRFRLRRLPMATCDRPTARAATAAACKHRRFPLYVMPKDLLNSFAFNLPFIWLAIYFDSGLVGLFALALMVCFRPVNIAAADIERVLYASVVQLKNSHQRIGPTIWRYMSRIILVAVPAFCLLFFFSEPIMTFVFGSKWQGCAPFVRWLAPWCLLSFVSTTLSFIPNVFSTQRGEFLFHVLLAVLWVGAMLWGILRHDFMWAIILYSLSGIVVAVLIFLWYVSQIRRYDRSVQ